MLIILFFARIVVLLQPVYTYYNIMEANTSINPLVNCAMVYGTSMGLFWILKFMLVPFIFTVPLTSLMFLGLTAAVPFLGYFFVRQYRNRYCVDGRIGFMQAWMFSLLMYAFAALLVSVAHYVFFRYIDGGTMVATYRSLLGELQNNAPELSDMVEQYNPAADLIASMTPIELTIQLVMNNLFYGMLLALPTALFVSLGRKREQDEQMIR